MIININIWRKLFAQATAPRAVFVKALVAAVIYFFPVSVYFQNGFC